MNTNTLNLDVLDYVDAQKIDVLAKLTANRDDLVKTAEIPSKDEIEQKPFGSFAVILNTGNGTYLRKYACYNQHLTELNTMLLNETKAEVPDEIVKTAAKMLKKACKRWRIDFPEELEKFANDCTNVTNIVATDRIDAYAWTKKRSAAALEKYAEATSVFALPKLNKYPIGSADLVKVAAAYFDKYFRKLTPENANEFVTNTKEAAAKLNVDLSDFGEFTKRANLIHTEYNPYYRAAINYRKQLVDADHREVYEELFQKHASLSPETAAAVLEKLDVDAGISHLWNNRIDDPYVSTFGVVKTAESFTIGGYDIDEGHLQTLETSGVVDDSVLADLRGDEGMDVFKSLPKPIQLKLAKEIHGGK